MYLFNLFDLYKVDKGLYKYFIESDDLCQYKNLNYYYQVINVKLDDIEDIVYDIEKSKITSACFMYKIC